jgi:hypothetical protein
VDILAREDTLKEMPAEELGAADRDAEADAVAAALGDALGEGYSAEHSSASAASRCMSAAAPTT